MTEGPPRIFVPVCKHPRDYQRTTGPLGWVEVKEVTQCPLLVEPPGNSFAQREPELAEAFAAEQAAIDELIQANCGEELQCKSGS